MKYFLIQHVVKKSYSLCHHFVLVGYLYRLKKLIRLVKKKATLKCQHSLLAKEVLRQQSHEAEKQVKQMLLHHCPCLLLFPSHHLVASAAVRPLAQRNLWSVPVELFPGISMLYLYCISRVFSKPKGAS